jgi:hypothetical protein
MKKEYNSIISKLEKEIGSTDDDKWNIEQLMNTGLENLLKLGEACENSSLADTRELIGLIYPENFTFRENQFQTTRLNEIINCIYLVNNRLRAKKTEQKMIFFFCPE